MSLLKFSINEHIIENSRHYTNSNKNEETRTASTKVLRLFILCILRSLKEQEMTDLRSDIYKVMHNKTKTNTELLQTMGSAITKDQLQQNHRLRTNINLGHKFILLALSLRPRFCCVVIKTQNCLARVEAS